MRIPICIAAPCGSSWRPNWFPTSSLRTCDIQSSRTTYEWNPDVRPSLYDLVIRLEGGIHETSNAFWSYENTYTMQPLHKVNKRYDALTREYLSSIYVDELDSPALSERSRAKLPHMNLQTTEHAEQHT